MMQYIRPQGVARLNPKRLQETAPLAPCATNPFRCIENGDVLLAGSLDGLGLSAKGNIVASNYYESNPDSAVSRLRRSMVPQYPQSRMLLE